MSNARIERLEKKIARLEKEIADRRQEIAKARVSIIWEKAKDKDKSDDQD